VTSAANNGFAGYPGHGKPGLIVTLLHNPVAEGKSHAGYAMGWFFGIRSNYQAADAVWGWGGARGVKLPDALQRQLESSRTMIHGQNKNLLELLSEYRDYRQFKNAEGQWDHESLRSTLLAMSIAARYLLMQEDPVAHAEQTVENLQPDRVELPLNPEDFHPGESFATYYGRRADAAIREKRKAEEAQRTAEEAQRAAEEAQRAAEEAQRTAEEAQRKTEEAQRKTEEGLRAMVARRRQRGHGDAEIAEDMGCTVREFLKRYPAQP
jgi:hypothetical protein